MATVLVSTLLLTASRHAPIPIRVGSGQRNRIESWSRKMESIRIGRIEKRTELEPKLWGTGIEKTGTEFVFDSYSRVFL